MTKENRLTYIYLVSHYRLSKQIKQQSDAFFEGLSQMIDQKWLRYDFLFLSSNVSSSISFFVDDPGAVGFL